MLKFFRHPGLTVPQNWHAGWLILRRTEPVGAVERLGLQPVYQDGRFVVFQL